MPKAKSIIIGSLFAIVIISMIVSSIPMNNKPPEKPRLQDNSTNTATLSVAPKSKIPVDNSEPKIDINLKNFADLSKYKNAQDEFCPAFKGYYIKSEGGAMAIAEYSKELSESTLKEDPRFDMLQAQKYLKGILDSKKYQFVANQNPFYRSFNIGCSGYYSENFLNIEEVAYAGTDFAFGFISLNGQDNILEPRLELYANKGNTLMFYFSDPLVAKEDLNGFAKKCEETKENDCYRTAVKERLSKINLKDRIKDVTKSFEIIG